MNICPDSRFQLLRDQVSANVTLWAVSNNFWDIVSYEVLVVFHIIHLDLISFLNLKYILYFDSTISVIKIRFSHSLDKLSLMLILTVIRNLKSIAENRQLFNLG